MEIMNNLTFRKILIIDADENAALPLCKHFGLLGFDCRAAKTLAEGKAFLAEGGFDAVISELFLPDGKATDLIGETPPLFILSSADGDDEIVEALSLGVSDYILKPCSPRVMEARLAARLPVKVQAVEHCGLTLDKRLRTASYLGKSLKLTSSEFNILFFLMTHPGKFFTADEIYEKVWNAASLQTSVVRFHISNLKKTLFSVTGKNLILSEFGVGYAFADGE